MLILSLLLLLAVPLPTKGDLYYVKPNDYNKTCPGEPCETLGHYVTHVSEYFRSDRTFQFISGDHLLAQNLDVGGIQNLTLIGDEHFLPGLLDLSAPSSQIHCNGSVGFSFYAINKLSIRNLLFSGCGALLNNGSTPYLRAALTLGGADNGSIFDVNISRITVQNSTGYGLFADNILGTSLITNSNFHFNNIGSESYFGGNARFRYATCPHLDNSTTTLIIESSRFQFGISLSRIPSTMYYYRGPGLALVFSNNSCSNVTIHTNHIIAYGNVGFYGGNMDILLYNTYVLSNAVFVNNSLIMNGNGTLRGGGLNIRMSNSHTSKAVPCGTNNAALQHFIVSVTNTTFLNNIAMRTSGAVSIEQYNDLPAECITQVITFENCTMINNTSITGGNSIYIQNDEVTEMYKSTYISPHLEVVFRNCTFSDNCDTLHHFGMPYGVIVLINAKVYFSGCTFEDNCGTAIFASSSNIIFENNNTFINNTGYNGGALHLCEGSLMYLSDSTSLNFSHNHAHAGGAIYAEKKCLFLYSDLGSTAPCFYQITEPYDFEKIHLSFQNNTVEFAGSALYGGTINNCRAGPYMDYPHTHVFDQLFHLKNSKLAPSLVSSDPVGVCFCLDGSPDCSLKVLHISVYPGENFTIPATTVGQRNGTVPGDIHAEFTDNTDNYTSIEPLQNSQTVSTYRSCANLMYTVHSPVRDKLAILKLTTDRSFLTQSVAWVTPSLNITLKECPPGFHISGTTYLCDCATVLKHHNIECDINTQSIYRPPSTWIGYHYATGNKNGILMYSHCPLGYCKSTTTELHIFSPDTQCALNRSGILCGACQSGLSLALGTSQCLDCSNKTLALLIAFSVAGLALVLLLVTCNLTVTEGTINGLIFYANIIWINRSIFFPPMTTNVLTVFIAWLNLDLGIQTCFYNGLDTYVKVWLQFVFPLYIWFLVAAIIYLSHRSTFVARLIGNNSVKVLATLFLLSYAKLQRTIIAALSVIFLTYPDGTNKWLWLHNANIEYLRGKHIPLFIAAFLALLFLSLPYTLLLLFIQCLRRLGGHRWRLLSWVARLLPLFDAYTAPYKFQYQFWTGFLLLMRALLFFVFALNYSDQPSLNLMVTVVATFLVFMLAWSLGGIYKNQVLNTLESSFLLNLGVVSVATLYTLHVGGNQAAVIDTSVGIALVMFFGIVVYQFLITTRLGKATVEKFKSFIPWNSCRQRLRGPVAADSDSDPAEDEPLIPPLVRYDPSQYRETLLSP